MDDPFLSPRLRMAGPLVIGPNFTTLEEVSWCWLFCADKSIDAFLLSQVSSDLRSMFIIATAIGIDPLGSEGETLYSRLVSLLQDRPANDSGTTPSRLRFFVEGTAPDALDAVSIIYRWFPYMAACSAAVVCVVVGIALRSPLFAGGRACLAIAICESVVFGLLVTVYQREPGIAQWTGWCALRSDGAISWITPVVVFCVTLGLAVAFDVPVSATYLRLTRLEKEGSGSAPLDLRDGGSDAPNTRAVPRPAVVVARETSLTARSRLLEKLERRQSSHWCAVATVGDVTAGGVICAVAMFGMMLSDVPVMNTFGFAFVTAGLMSTFGLQLVVAPCLATCIGTLCKGSTRR